MFAYSLAELVRGRIAGAVLKMLLLGEHIEWAAKHDFIGGDRKILAQTGARRIGITFERLAKDAPTLVEIGRAHV